MPLRDPVSYASTRTLVAVEGPSGKTTGELARESGEWQQQARQASASREFHSLSVARGGAGQSVKTASALASPLEAEGFEKGQSLPETPKQEVRAYGGASPPTFLLGLGTVKGQSARESESQQVAAIPTHKVKLTNKTGGGRMKNGGGKDKPKQSPAL